MFHLFFRFLMANKPDQNGDNTDGLRMKYEYFMKEKFILNLVLVLYKQKKLVLPILMNILWDIKNVE